MIRMLLTLGILLVQWVDKTEYFATFIWRIIRTFASEFPEMRRERAQYLKEWRANIDFSRYELQVGETFGEFQCPICKKVTKQICYDNYHLGRDFPIDTRRCTKCGKIGLGSDDFKKYL